MAAPLAKGLIITASVLVAAGIAFYENEQIREWFNESRRKLAIALHSLGDEINPQSSGPHRDSQSEDDPDARRRRREEIIRLNRLELVKKARDEGVAVDLDQLAALGKAYDDETAEIRSRADRSRSFDDIVGSDGMLRGAEMTELTVGQTTAISNEGQGGVVRLRGAGSRGLETGSHYANPFGDEMEVHYDQDQEQQSRESSHTLSPEPLVDVSDAQSEYFSQDEMEAQIEEAIRRSLGDVSEAPVTEKTPAEDPPTSVPASTLGDESFYYAPPPNVSQPPMSTNSLYASAIQSMLDEPLYVEDDDEAHTPAGTLTPTDDGFSTIASVASGGDDIGHVDDLASIAGEAPMQHDDQMSEGGYTSEFSMVGASTPGSWTDVESEAGEEDGHQGHVQTLHQNPATSS